MASEAEVAAVLSALAGVRRGDPVAAVSAGRLTRACLSAGSGHALLDEQTAPAATARVVVLAADLDPGDVDPADLVDPAERVTARRLLAPGGRFVALATDAQAARCLADELGLHLRHVEPLGAQVAWSAISPLAP